MPIHMGSTLPEQPSPNIFMATTSEPTLYQPHDRANGEIGAFIQPGTESWVASALALAITEKGGFSICNGAQPIALIPKSSPFLEDFVGLMDDIRSGRQTPEVEEHSDGQ